MRAAARDKTKVLIKVGAWAFSKITSKNNIPIRIN